VLLHDPDVVSGGMKRAEWQPFALLPVIAVIVVDADGCHPFAAQGLDDPESERGLPRGAVTGDGKHDRPEAADVEGGHRDGEPSVRQRLSSTGAKRTDADHEFDASHPPLKPGDGHCTSPSCEASRAGKRLTDMPGAKPGACSQTTIHLSIDGSGHFVPPAVLELWEVPIMQFWTTARGATFEPSDSAAARIVGLTPS
jgi:hypothetical protein